MANDQRRKEIDIEALFRANREERRRTQMTLGKLVEFLQYVPSDAPFANLSGPHSYRGFYEDLAFEVRPGTQSAEALLQLCRTIPSQTFFGYKGGTYVMDFDTPVWIAEYGSCGRRLMAMNSDGTVETAPLPMP